MKYSLMMRVRSQFRDRRAPEPAFLSAASRPYRTGGSACRAPEKDFMLHADACSCADKDHFLHGNDTRSHVAKEGFLHGNDARSCALKKFRMQFSLILASFCLLGSVLPALAAAPSRSLMYTAMRNSAHSDTCAALAAAPSRSFTYTSEGNPVRMGVCAASSSINFPKLIVLSEYQRSMKIGEEFYLCALSTGLILPTFRSSSSRIASVNTYGLVTARKAGTCRITAKVSGAEASCTVTVQKTGITLSQKRMTLERGQSFRLSAKTTNGSPVAWKSSKKSVAAVSSDGTVTARKTGQATISASADGTTASCVIVVKKPDMKINHRTLTLHRKEMFQLYAHSSSGIRPAWKSSRSSVATVDEYGMVKAIKHGTCVITASLDGVSRSCEVTVKSPVITLTPEDLTLIEGQTRQLSAVVSSGIRPTWKSSNTNVAVVNDSGMVKALSKGHAVIYCSEDGAKECCRITVTSKETVKQTDRTKADSNKKRATEKKTVKEKGAGNKKSSVKKKASTDKKNTVKKKTSTNKKSAVKKKASTNQKSTVKKKAPTAKKAR